MTIYLPYIISFIISIVFIIILIATNISYHKLLKRYYKIKNKEAVMREEARSKAIKLAEDAEDKIEHMMEEAHLKAAEIMHQGDIFNNEEKSRFEGELKSVHESEFEEYKKELSQIRSQFLAEARESVADFEKLIRQDMNAIRSQVANTILASEKGAEAEIAEYKRRRMEEASKAVEEAIEKVAIDALGHSLTGKDQKDLVMKALERAKSEDVL